MLRLALSLAVVLSCSATEPTPSGTQILEWDLSQARPKPPTVAGAKTSHEKTLQTAGAELWFKFETAEIQTSSGDTKQSPVHVVVSVVDAGGFAISGGLSQYPVHAAGAPPGQLSVDFRGTLTRGRKGCMGTTYENESMLVRIAGDGTAELRTVPDPVPQSSR